MTPGLTALGLGLLLGGVAVIAMGSSGVATVLGLSILAPGAALSTVAFIDQRETR